MKVYNVRGHYKIWMESETIEAKSRKEAIEKYLRMIESGEIGALEECFQDNETYIKAEFVEDIPI